MKVKTNYFLLGLFVIVGTFAVVAGVLTVGATTFARRGLIVETYFEESVTGLEKGAIVRFRGVRIGVVTDIKLVSQLYDTGQAYAAVRCLLEPTDIGLDVEDLRLRLQQRIAQGYRARLASQGLTGSLYIEMDLVTDPELLNHHLVIDWTPEHPYVPSVPSRISRLGSSVERVLSSLEQTDFPGVVSDARETLQAVRDTARSLDLDALKKDVAGVRSAAEETLATARERIDSVSERAEALLEDVNRVVAAADPEAVRRTVDGFAALADALPETRASLDRLLASTRDTSEELRAELRGKSRDVDLILSELRRASARFAALAETLERYPSLLLIGNPPRRTEPGK